MFKSLVVGFLAVVCAALTIIAVAGETENKDVRQILEIHRQLIEAHRTYDAEKLFSFEADEVVSANRGEVTIATREERFPRFEDYLKSAKFEKYEDLIDPIVRVSDDGTLGWLICQVEIVGTREVGEGETASLDSVWAWIELYEKRDGRWYRIGDVSNVKPQE